MSKHTETVKQIAELYKKASVDQAESGQLEQSERNRTRSIELFAALSELERLESLTSPLSKSMGDLSDLPPELLAELNITKTDEIEDQIFTVINAFEGEADLDQILVGLFRKFNVTQKRRYIQNKLYKMMKSEMIWSVEGRKGVYSTSEQEEAEAPFKIDTGDFDSDPEYESKLDPEIPF